MLIRNRGFASFFFFFETQTEALLRISFVVMVYNVQHWYKDEKYSTRVKDAEGHPCFSLVNKATGEAVKHSVGATQPVSMALLSSFPWTRVFLVNAVYNFSGVCR